MTTPPPVLVVDFGAQYAQLIARRVREAHVYSEIVPHSMPVAEMLAKRPAAIILSGGPSSVYEDGAPQVDPAMFTAGVPAPWTSNNVSEEQVEAIGARVGSKRVLCALSGGVDSAVAAALVHKAVGDQLTCVFVDHGLLRAGEAEQVEKDYVAATGIT